MFHKLMSEWKLRRRKKMAMREKTDFVTAYTWIFGCTKKAAAIVYREEKSKKNMGYIENVIACFKGNAKRCFMDD